MKNIALAGLVPIGWLLNIIFLMLGSLVLFGLLMKMSKPIFFYEIKSVKLLYLCNNFPGYI